MAAALDELASRFLGDGAGDNRAACPLCAKRANDDAVSVTINADGTVVAHCHRCHESGFAKNEHPPISAATHELRDHKTLWTAGVDIGDAQEHPYLIAKQVFAYGIRLAGQSLLLPARNVDGVLTGVETIAPHGEKRWVKGSIKAGSFHTIGQIKDMICVAEGYATGASVFEATNYAVAIAFDAGNLAPVCQNLRSRYPKARIVVCADDDFQTKGNPGVTAARRAADRVNGLVAIPVFPVDNRGNASDFNDLASISGLDAVKQCIANAETPPRMPGVYRRDPIDLVALANYDPKPREWAVAHWIGIGHVTLLSGLGGIGKSILAQQFATALGLGRHFVSEINRAFNVLMWAAEDDDEELRRRQKNLCLHFESSPADLDDRLSLHSMAKVECGLLEVVAGQMTRTPMLDELREQIGDYRSEVVILDNIAALFGGNENDRHHVSSFINAINWAAEPTGAAVMLLGHTAKMAGSEYSGSTAWENAARARLWFTDKLPDAPADREIDDEAPTDLRYLAKRKANYSSRDICTLQYQNGAYKINQPPAEFTGVVKSMAEENCKKLVLESMTKLRDMGLEPTEGHASPYFLPRLMLQHGLAKHFTKKDLGAAMRRLMTDGILKREKIGEYPNRSPRFGLAIHA